MKEIKALLILDHLFERECCIWENEFVSDTTLDTGQDEVSDYKFFDFLIRRSSNNNSEAVVSESLFIK